MYPLAIILGVALLRKDKNVAYYALPLSIIGALIALYHYLLQMTSIFDIMSTSCSASVPCKEKQALFFGFVTIPFLSLVAFLVILVMMLLLLKPKQK